MAEISYPRERFGGIWLLDKEALKQLDDLLDSYLVKFEEQKKQDLESEYRKRRKEFLEDPIYAKWAPEKQEQELSEIEKKVAKSYSFSQDARVLKLTLESGKTLTASRFSEVEHDLRVQDDAPTGFNLSLRCGRIEVEVEITSGWAVGGFEATVKPATPGVAQECLVAIRQWVDQHKTHKAFWIWQEASGFHWIIWGFVVLCLIAVADITTKSTANASPGRIKLKEEARELLKNGIQKQEEQRAIELILAIQSDYDPNPVQPTPFWGKAWFWIVIGLITVLAVFLSFPPRTAIAVGRRGVEQVASMKSWINLTAYTIPSLALSVFVVPVVKDAIQKSL